MTITIKCADCGRDLGTRVVMGKKDATIEVHGCQCERTGYMKGFAEGKKQGKTATKEHPIVFSRSMVRDILYGRKTQMRRAIKPQPTVFDNAGVPDFACLKDPKRHWMVGDKLWVRETWKPTRSLKWRPAIQMPKWAARMWLEITGMRIERLQDISERDAEAEGIEWVDHGAGKTYRDIKEPKTMGYCWVDPSVPFQDLWDSLNKALGYGWDLNPWVWVIEFRLFEN